MAARVAGEVADSFELNDLAGRDVRKRRLAGAALVYFGEEPATIDGIRLVPYAQTAQLLFGES